MPVEFDRDTITCSIDVEGQILQSAIPDVVVSRHHTTRAPYARIAGRVVAVTEDEADALAINGAQDERHHAG